MGLHQGAGMGLQSHSQEREWDCSPILRGRNGTAVPFPWAAMGLQSHSQGQEWDCRDRNGTREVRVGEF